MVDADVAVVGAGPVGSLLAGELALHGVRTLLLEKLPTPSEVSKAGTLHARTAQSLQLRGLRDAVQPGVPAGPPGGPVPFHFAGMFALDLAAVVDHGPAILGSPQAYAERVFAARAQRLGARVERDSEVVDATDRGDHVELVVTDVAGRQRRIRAGWVVGCDGARSTVRKAAGIEFAGTPATVSALIGEVRLVDPDAAPFGWQRNPRGWTLFWVNPFGHSRVCTYDFRGPHPDRSAPVTLEELGAEVERIAGRPVPMTSPRWLARFSDAALQARRYRAGRILLAGDAAHVHFPAGGQGVNLGLQDAMNLAWKLAARVHGWAPRNLLDTYHSERHPVAADVLHNVAAQMALMHPDPRVDPLRELFADLMRLPQVNAVLGGMISGTDVAYQVGRAADPLAGTFAPDVPLSVDGRPTSLAGLMTTGHPMLLDLADRPELRRVAQGWAGRVLTVTATERPDARAGADGPANLGRPDGIGQPGGAGRAGHPGGAGSAGRLGTDALLVRPDGYLVWSSGWSGSDESTLDEALRRWFGEPGPAPGAATGHRVVDRVRGRAGG